MTAPSLRHRRYVLAGQWPPEHADAIAEHGWSVVNAPRPLHGRATWVGSFLAGIHYAAGPFDEYAERWYADDATLLTPITPPQVLQRIRSYFREHGYDFERVCQEDASVPGAAADDLGLPWQDAWLVDPALRSDRQADLDES